MQAAIELPPLYRKQHAAICDPARFVVIEASTKSGKTLGCLLWILGEAWNRPRSTCWWVAPTFEVTKTVGYERLRSMLRDADPEKRIWEENASRLTLTLANGSKVAFKSADNPDTLYGEDVNFAVIDEATRCGEDAWHAVRSTLSATKGRCRIIGNLKGRKNWAYRLARQAESGTESDIAYHKLTASDAVEGKVLDADEVERAEDVVGQLPACRLDLVGRAGVREAPMGRGCRCAPGRDRTGAGTGHRATRPRPPRHRTPGRR